MVREEDDNEVEIPEGFFTHEGVLYLRAVDTEFEPFLRDLTGAIAAASMPAFHSLMSSLAGVIPSELEDGMSRMRNVRLAEYGFLPFDEAISIYSPLSLEQMNLAGKPAAIVDITADEEDRALIPFLPLHEGPQGSFLQEALRAVKDPLIQDRMRLEFAGLANQIASVEGLARMELTEPGPNDPEGRRLSQHRTGRNDGKGPRPRRHSAGEQHPDIDFPRRIRAGSPRKTSGRDLDQNGLVPQERVCRRFLGR